MSTTPEGKNDRISYYEEHAPIFVTNAEALGVDPTLAADLQTKATAARAAYNAQLAAQTAARAAVLACNNAVSEMSRVGGQVITQIRATAKIQGDDIYVLAGLPAPATPSPVGPPGKPENFEATLFPNGSLQLSWTCQNPPNAAGPLYHIYRRESTDAPWTFIAGTGEKKHLDTTVPAGVSHVFYQVQAARATSVGVAAEFIVNFGVAPSGSMTATVTSMPKLAA